MVGFKVIIFTLVLTQTLVLADFASLSVVREREKIQTGDDYNYTHVSNLDLSGPITSISFTVQACNDAFITLQPNKTAITSNPAYEILIGGWENTASVIRKSFGGAHLATHRQSGLLSCQKPRAFWVSWAGGVIKVGQGETVTECTKFMEYRDPSPLPVVGVAVATGWGASGIWVINKPHEKIIMKTRNEHVYHQVPGIDASRAKFITFKVKAKNDAHISLQPAFGAFNRFAYEIVIGGWSNTQSVIKRLSGGAIKARYPGAVLNQNEERDFWISWDDNAITVGKGSVVGQSRMMRFVDVNLQTIKAVIVSTAWGASGEWVISNPLN